MFHPDFLFPADLLGQLNAQTGLQGLPIAGAARKFLLPSAMITAVRHARHQRAQEDPDDGRHGVRNVQRAQINPQPADGGQRHRQGIEHCQRAPRMGFRRLCGLGFLLEAGGGAQRNNQLFGTCHGASRRQILLAGNQPCQDRFVKSVSSASALAPRRPLGNYGKKTCDPRTLASRTMPAADTARADVLVQGNNAKKGDRVPGDEARLQRR